MKQIVKNFKGHTKEIVLGPLFKLFEAVLELMVPLVMANIIDIGIGNKQPSYLLKGGIVLVLLAALGLVAALICQYYAALAAGNFGRNLRKQLYSHIMSFKGEQREQFTTGGLITRLTNDVNQMQTGVNMAIRLATRVPFLAIGSIVMAMVINWRAGLVFLACTPLIILVLYSIMKRTLPTYENIQSKQDTLARLSAENLEGTRVIRAFSRQQQEQLQFDDSAGQLASLGVQAGKIAALLNPVTNFIVSLAIGCLVWLGAKFANVGAIQPGQVIALVNYMNQTLLALIVAANLIVLFTRAAASTRRVAHVLDAQPSITGGSGAAIKKECPAIEVQGLTFTYHKGAANALENITFTLEKGHTFGIIGGTGSGKSTLAALLQQEYQPCKGGIRLFGNPAEQYTLSQIHSLFGFVAQRPSLLTGTVRYNLLLGRDIPDEKLWQALAIAQAKDFVSQMPQGLDEMIEEGGKNLSGGQRQRLTIARALAANPPVLILDDASSALDYATDAALRRELSRLENSTAIIISQRAASVKNADNILVLADGQMAGLGSHDMLLKHCPVYKEICISQGLLEKQEAKDE